MKENRESNKFAYKVGIIKSTEKGPSRDMYGHEFFDLNSVYSLEQEGKSRKWQKHMSVARAAIMVKLKGLQQIGLPAIMITSCHSAFSSYRRKCLTLFGELRNKAV